MKTIANSPLGALLREAAMVEEVRRSDGSILPLVFTVEEVREERRRTNNMWWV